MGYLGCAEEPDPVPAGLAATVAAMVARSLSALAVGVESVTSDSTTIRYTDGVSDGGVWLSRTDMMALRPYRCGGGLTSVKLVGERYTITP